MNPTRAAARVVEAVAGTDPATVDALADGLEGGRLEEFGAGLRPLGARWPHDRKLRKFHAQRRIGVALYHLAVAEDRTEVTAELAASDRFWRTVAAVVDEIAANPPRHDPDVYPRRLVLLENWRSNEC